MHDEIESHRSKGTWKLVPRPIDAKVIEGMWILKKKNDSGNTKFKARYVAKGFRQKYGVDYTETFAPVIRISSIRLMISIAAINNLHIHHIDVKTAYLNSPLNETIYMHQPYLFEQGKDLVCKLERAIYGLKQSARCWHERLSQVLHSMKFEQLQSDACIFFCRDTQTMIGFYVDDLIILSGSEHIIAEIKKNLSANFEIIDKGPLSCFLGISVTRDENGIHLSQSDFIDDLLSTHEMSNCKGISLPMATGQNLSEFDNSPLLKDKTPFQSIVGSVVYLANSTRPDIQFAVSQLCKYMACPRQAHLQAAKNLLRYLKQTKETSLSFSNKVKDDPFEIYCDADFANDEENSKSVSGVVVFNHKNAISWSTHIQQTVASSTCEAEILAMKEGVQDAIYYVNLIREITLSPDFGPIRINNDNQSAIRTIEGSGKFGNNRHYITRVNFIRDYVRQSFVKLDFVKTEAMLADGLTKPLGRTRFNDLFIKCGMRFR